MSLDQSNLFISNNRAMKKQLTQAIALAKKKQPDVEYISTFIMEAFTHDKRVQQNLIVAIEKLVENNNLNAARALAIASIRAVPKLGGGYNKLAALDIGYSLPRAASSDDMYRALIRINVKLKYFKAAFHLTNCLSSTEEIENRKKGLEKQFSDNVETRHSLIYEQLALIHVKRYNNDDDGMGEISTKRKVQAPFIFPILVWKRRSLLSRMVSRDLRQKYHKSILGGIWAILEPLALTITFLFLHEIMSSGSALYRPLNIMIGILFWSLFTQLVNNGTRFLENNASYIQKMAIPREIFLLSTCGFSVATLLLNMLALIPLAIYYELIPTEKIIMMPITILLIVLYGLGIVMFTSILQVKWRDTGQIVSVTTRVGFYFTPVFYTIDMLTKSRIPAEFLAIYFVVNPMSVFLSMARTSITNQPIGIEPMFIIIAATQAVVLFVLGSYWFQKKQNKAVKYL